MIAASGTASAPVAEPTTTPHSRYNCHGCVMNTDSPAPTATWQSANVTTLRTPKRSTIAAAKGAPRPYTIRLTDTAPPISACDQPNSWPSGTIRTLGTERKPAAIMSTTNVTAATTKA